VRGNPQPFQTTLSTGRPKNVTVPLRDLAGVNRRLIWQLYNRDLYRHKDDINVICELLAVKHGDYYGVRSQSAR